MPDVTPDNLHSNLLGKEIGLGIRDFEDEPELGLRTISLPLHVPTPELVSELSLQAQFEQQ